jgi:hypothetical protein
MAAGNHVTEPLTSDVERFCSDPVGYFGSSYTEMHSVPRERLEAVQRAAIGRRFERQRETIPMVAKLASRQGIEEVADFGEVVPMMFEHTMYKSYPMALLERQRFDLLTKWLDKLTAVDLGEVDASGCKSIDTWLDALAAQTDLDVCHTSGTSGTMSFFPWSGHDLAKRWAVNRVTVLQPFGQPVTSTALDEPFHVVQRVHRYRSSHMRDTFTFGRDDLVHLALPRPSADLLWLGARLRMAAARGDSSRVDVPQTLLARRGELEQVQAGEQQAMQAWVGAIAGLRGENLLWMSFPFEIHSIAANGLDTDARWSFGPESIVVVMGGAKGRQVPDDWMQRAQEFIRGRVVQAYGMTELSGFQMMCREGRYHFMPWAVPFVLDPESSELLPRTGVQTGRFAFFDLLPADHWGGLMTGDEVEVDFDSLCPCGATSQHMSHQVSRLSDKRGGDDKITCTATPQAYEEAMEFLTQQ